MTASFVPKGGPAFPGLVLVMGLLASPAVAAAESPAIGPSEVHETWVWIVDQADGAWLCIVQVVSGSYCWHVTPVEANDDVYYVVVTTKLGASSVWHETNGCEGLQPYPSECAGAETAPDERLTP